MWNITELDRDYYKRKEQENIKHRRSISKANNRGEVSEEWHKQNSLTPATLSEFKILMKQADKDWEAANCS